MGSRNIFFTESIVKHWNRLPRELIESLPLELFKTHVDRLGGHADGI